MMQYNIYNKDVLAKRTGFRETQTDDEAEAEQNNAHISRSGYVLPPMTDD